eukprot:14212113-Heterocapsa_arctica.AAC.1
MVTVDAPWVRFGAEDERSRRERGSGDRTGSGPMASAAQGIGKLACSQPGPAARRCALLQWAT